MTELTTLTEEQATTSFMDSVFLEILALEKEWGGKDRPLRNEEWGAYLDYLCKSELITQDNCDEWLLPKEAEV